MLLLVFGILAGISLVVVALGFLVDIPFYSAIGFFFLFLLGLSLQGGGVTASNQSTHTYSYLTNSSLISTIQIFDTETPISDENSIWIGRFLSFASGFAMILVFTHWKKGNIVK
jgi:hypothetical protein